MSNPEPTNDPLALVALSGLPTPPPTKPPAEKTLAQIAAEILAGGGE